MVLRYASVCSGIEAATMAWHTLGWEPAFFSEIEPFPSAVLAHHYGSNMPGEPPARNGVPNHGDFTKISDEAIDDAGPVDLLVGGTPCQSFSVAGKRLGLDDPRGNLALEYLRLAVRLRARWFLWENVPGVLSSVTDEEDGDGGVRPGLEGREAGDEWIEESDFATFLSFVRECGYGFAYRVLDAQYVRVDGFGRAVPQRRRRVFVVGYLGDWRRAAAVLLEPQGMRGDSPPRRQSGQGVAPTIASRPSGGGGLGTDFDLDGGFVADVCGTINSSGGNAYPGQTLQDAMSEQLVAFGGGNTSGPLDVSMALTAHGRRQDFDASEDGTGRGTPIVPVAGAICRDSFSGGAGGRPEGAAAGHFIPVAFDCKASGRGGSSRSYVSESWAVRRLTPTECERLQGFPDDFTNIPWRGGNGAPDGPRYRALGNSMAVNVMRWIGWRIDRFEKLVSEGRILR